MIRFPRISDSVPATGSGILAGILAVLCLFAGFAKTIRGNAAAREHSRARCLPAAFYSAPLFWRLIVFVSALFLVYSSDYSYAAIKAGTNIDNTASALYGVGGTGGQTSHSNMVRITTTVFRTVAKLEFLQYAPGSPAALPEHISPTEYSTSGAGAGPFVTLPLPRDLPGGSLIDLSSPIPLVEAKVYHGGEPMFLRLSDGDQNLDPGAVESVLVTITDTGTGDAVMLRLYETGPNTGIFTGYIQSGIGAATINDGTLSVGVDSKIDGTYVDIVDGSDTSADAALIDPYGKVFNSMTGQLVNGAVITIMNADTNTPAVVYGDDGVSSFPSSIISGGTTTDTAASVLHKTYTFPPGEFRFPFVKPGNYRIQVSPPAGYTAPSQVSDAAMASLPNGPFSLVTPGSRGEVFVVAAGPAIHIDIPIDPLTKQIQLVKSASKSQASIGDFVQYLITAENTDPVLQVSGALLSDRLPPGFRYRQGSAKLNKAPLADPVISSDGRTLTFALGNLAPKELVSLTYVAMIGAGSKPGPAVNSATATSPANDVISNTTTVSILVQDDFLRNKAHILGQVFVDGCGDSEAADPKADLNGLRLFLENGTYVVTDKNGMYHFEAVNPGTHVVQLDLDTIPGKYEVLPCEQNTRFSGTPYSQFVDLQGGTVWRADFHLGLRPPAIGETGIALRSILITRAAGTGNELSSGQTNTAALASAAVQPEARLETVEFTVPIHVGSVPLRAMRLVVMLPKGMAYIQGSSSLNALPQPDPKISDTVLTFGLGEAAADWEGTLRFSATVPALGESERLPTKAFMTFSTPQSQKERTPVVENIIERQSLFKDQIAHDIVLRPRFAVLSAELTKTDQQNLDLVIKDLKKVIIKHLTVTGHTDGDPILGKGKLKFADNYELSRARAKTIGEYLARELNLAPDQVTYIGKGPDEPVATNKTVQGKALNRRVEVDPETNKIIAWSEMKSVVETSGMKGVATIGLRPGEVWEKAKNPDEVNRKTMPEYDKAWVDAAEPGTAWLWPPENQHPPIPSAKFAIKHAPGRTMKLFLNGWEVEGLYLDGMVKNQDGTVAVSTWTGVHLEDGDNLFEIVMYDENGEEMERLKHVMHYSTQPINAKPVPALSRLIADSKTPPMIAVRLTDKDGHPAREGLIGEFSIDAPNMPLQRAEDLNRDPLTASANDRLKYVVGEDGIVLIELQPTTRTGEAVLHFNLMNGVQDVKVWLKSESRDWILVGLAEGTVGYNAVTGNMESMTDSGIEDKLYTDDKLAFYAKGRIKGEWLLTLAYNSEKKGKSGDQALYQTIDPNQYYTLYGDATQQGYDAASTRKIYMKLERDQFYALFGDYSTGLTVSELSRYNRNFNGLKSELKSEHLDFTLFASDTNQGFVKDELPGDGTSGLYRLSRQNILMNSETITIETRDRFRSEVIVATQKLIRFIDYSIDYENGTIFFKSPVFSRDQDLNPVFIVVDYESFDSSDLSWNYGGRGALRTFGNTLETGMTYIHEGGVGKDKDLTGLDVTYRLGKTTQVKAEVATTDQRSAGGNITGSAYVAEVMHQSEKMDGKIYVREQDGGFGLGQQNGSEYGTRKMGLDLLYRVTPATSVKGETYRQENLLTNATRDLAEFQARYGRPRYDLYGGLRYVGDTQNNGEVNTAEQLIAGISSRATERLTLKLQHEQSLSNQNGVNDFPTRTTMGADYKLTATTSVFAAQELTWGEHQDTALTRIGLQSSPWTGSQLGSTVERQTAENGERLFSTTGLKQVWQLSDRWAVDAGLDRAATIRQTAGASSPVAVPDAAVGTDFTAVSLGAGFREKMWTWNGRIENRHSDTEDKLGLLTGVYGEVRPGLGLAAGLSFFSSEYVTGVESKRSDLRFSLAYRPRETRWIMLDRLEFLNEEQRGGELTYDNWRVINNFNLNYKLVNRTQVAFQYANKYVAETIDAQDYRGYTDLSGVEVRYDITKKWDCGLRESLLHSWQSRQKQYGTGISTGYSLADNMWLSIGYNLSGYKDRDFSRSDFTSEGFFMKFRMKFDQVSAGKAVKWFAGL